jgi:creatinine amidohydrolase/Fe(II)-dependent formamide hydrolase-like protein
VPLLETLAGELTTAECRVHSAATYRFNDLDDARLRVGGHAGLSETTWLLAFRPDLVDLTELDDGPLVVRETGVLHARPVVEPEFNPREASLKLAQELRECVVANFVAYVREAAEISTEFF